MNRQNQKVIVWMLVLCLMVLMMLVIGAVTRLTGSGLSITEWNPIMGAIPPLTDADWQNVFLKYQSSPQYQLVNKGMSLSEFQWIFFWEYFHRLLARLLGFVFLIPWAIFWYKGFFNFKRAFQLLGGFLLGGLQGLMGWLMVASGLVNQPNVSHYRLALHLILALIILAYFWKMIWLFSNEESSKIKDHIKPSPFDLDNEREILIKPISVQLNILFVLLIIQILYGAFVAGLRAGFIANTFPDMEGRFFPLGALALTPSWVNVFENPLLVQWIHRIVAWLLLGWSLWLFKNIFRIERLKELKMSFFGLVIVLILQFGLGVFTILFKVPLPLGVLHQFGAAIVLLYVLWLKWTVNQLLKE